MRVLGRRGSHVNCRKRAGLYLNKLQNPNSRGNRVPRNRGTPLFGFWSLCNKQLVFYFGLRVFLLTSSTRNSYPPGIRGWSLLSCLRVFHLRTPLLRGTKFNYQLAFSHSCACLQLLPRTCISRLFEFRGLCNNQLVFFPCFTYLPLVLFFEELMSPRSSRVEFT